MFQVVGTYLTIIGLTMLVLSPVVIVSLISLFHRYANWRRADLPRQGILDRLGSGPRPKLVLIHAPGGYGKSIVAKQWVETLTKQKA